MAEFSKADVERITTRVIVRLCAMTGAGDEDIKQVIDEEIGSDSPVAERVKHVIAKRVEAALTDPGTGDVIAVVPEACNCVEGDRHCATACVVDAISKGADGITVIDRDKCVDCGLCVEACRSGGLVERTQCLQLVEMLRTRQEQPVYAIVAPSFVAQFGNDVSPVQIKAGIRRLGFTDVYEVAMAADVLTVLEADEFLERTEAGEKFVITSCCCPAFIKLVEKHRPNVAHLVSDTVSPMIALGRMLKKREPGCRVVFIGPCLAKRAESKRPELADAIDGVLTYKELASLFEVSGIDLTDEPGLAITPFREASHDGRIYAHTGGVTAAIHRAILALRPDAQFHPMRGDGLKQCNQILQEVEKGKANGNFMEGMACTGGCVGGPGTCIRADEGAHKIESFANRAEVQEARANQLASRWANQAGDISAFYSLKHVDEHKGT